MRLTRIQEFLKEKGWAYTYEEEDGLGSVDFEYRGIPYHIWEFREEEFGAESNVRNGNRQEDFLGDYQEKMIEIMEGWQ